MGLFRSALKLIGLASKGPKFTMVASPTKSTVRAAFSSKREAIHKAARKVAASPDEYALPSGLPSPGRAITHGVVMATKSDRNAVLAPVALAGGAAATYALAKANKKDGWVW